MQEGTVVESTFDDIDFDKEDISNDFSNLLLGNIMEGLEIIIDDGFIEELEDVDDDFALKTLPIIEFCDEENIGLLAVTTEGATKLK